MVRMTSWFTRLVGGRPRAACWWRGGRRGGASGAEPSVNLTQTCPAGPGQPRETNNNLESVRSGLKKPRSVASDDRVQRISWHRTRTTRIALTSRGAAPTSLPTFCLKFCLHWVELSPRNCMDPDTHATVARYLSNVPNYEPLGSLQSRECTRCSCRNGCWLQVPRYSATLQHGKAWY